MVNKVRLVFVAVVQLVIDVVELIKEELIKRKLDVWLNRKFHFGVFMIVNVTNLGGNSAVLSFDQKVRIVKTYISSPDGWQKVAQSIKNTGGSARAQSLSILRKIAEDDAVTKNESSREVFDKLVATLDWFLARV